MYAFIKKFSNNIYIVIITITIIIPVTKINKQEILELRGENRNANRYKTLKMENKINYRYGNDFNKWFGDRFRNREYFLQKNKLLYSAFNIDSQFFKDGWKKDNLIPNKLTLLTKEELENYKKHIVKFDNWCKKRKIKCYIVNMREKEIFLREYIGYDNDLIEKSNTGKQLNEYLSKNGVNFQIVDLHEKMFDLMHKGEILFWKTDGHQTSITSFLIYKEILNAIKKDFSNFKLAKDEDYEITYQKSNIDKDYCKKNNIFFCTPYNTLYKTIRNKKNNYITIQNSFTGYTEKDGTSQPQLQQTKYVDGNPQTILYLGRSYSSRHPYMSYSFQNLYWKGIWHNVMAEKYCKDIAKKYNFDRGCFSQEHIDGIMNEFKIKPDIVVLLDNNLEYIQDF